MKTKPNVLIFDPLRANTRFLKPKMSSTFTLNICNSEKTLKNYLDQKYDFTIVFSEKDTKMTTLYFIREQTKEKMFLFSKELSFLEYFEKVDNVFYFPNELSKNELFDVLNFGLVIK